MEPFDHRAAGQAFGLALAADHLEQFKDKAAGHASGLALAADDVEQFDDRAAGQASGMALAAYDLEQFDDRAAGLTSGSEPLLAAGHEGRFPPGMGDDGGPEVSRMSSDAEDGFGDDAESGHGELLPATWTCSLPGHGARATWTSSLPGLRARWRPCSATRAPVDNCEAIGLWAQATT